MLQCSELLAGNTSEIRASQNDIPTRTPKAAFAQMRSGQVLLCDIIIDTIAHLHEILHMWVFSGYLAQALRITS